MRAKSRLGYVIIAILYLRAYYVISGDIILKCTQLQLVFILLEHTCLIIHLMASGYENLGFKVYNIKNCTVECVYHYWKNNSLRKDQ